MLPWFYSRADGRLPGRWRFGHAFSAALCLCSGAPGTLLRAATGKEVRVSQAHFVPASSISAPTGGASLTHRLAQQGH